MIFATFEKHFLMIIPKKLDDQVILWNDRMFPSHLPSGVTKKRFMNHSLTLFLSIVIRKQWGYKVHNFHILGAISNYFRTGIPYDPVDN